MEITDNTLKADYFESLQETIMSNIFSWQYSEKVGNPDDEENGHFYFVHRLYENFSPLCPFFEDLIPYIDDVLKANAIIRARVLLYTNQETLIEHCPHTDMPYSHKAALLYINTNNGFTRMPDKSKVHSVANRNVIFDGSQVHNSTNCTDEKARFVLSVNYF